MPNQYQDRPLTVQTAKRVIDKYQSGKKFVLVNGGTSAGKTYIAIKVAAMMSPDTTIAVLAPKGKISDDSWQSSAESYNTVMQTHLKVLSITFDSFWRPKHQPEFISQLKECQSLGGPTLLVMDEVHEIKKSTTHRAKAAIQFAMSDLVTKSLGLSATPTPNSYVDFSTYLILNGTYKNQTEFYEAQVIEYDQFHQPIIKDHHGHGRLSRTCFVDPDFLDTEMSSMTVYVDREQFVDQLPKVTTLTNFFTLQDTKRYVEPEFAEFGDVTPRTRAQHYRQALKYYKHDMYDGFQSIRKTLSHISAKDPQRMQAIEYMIQNLSKPFVVFYVENVQRDYVLLYLKIYHPDWEIRLINGKVKDRSPVTTDKTIYLIQYRAGGTGIELKHTYGTVYYYPTYSWKDMKQSAGRNVRSGMDHDIIQIQVACRDAIDWQIWRAISDKRDFNSKLTLVYLEDALSELESKKVSPIS